jgi:hypothetical protein
LDNLGHVENADLLAESDGKDNQEEKVPEFCRQLVRISGVYGGGCFVGFLEKIGSQVREFLLPIPRTTARAAENHDELFERSKAVGHWILCSVKAEWRERTPSYLAGVCYDTAVSIVREQ